MNLTIYSDNFDNYSYVVGRGMNGKVFVEDGKSGREFRNIQAALEHIVRNNIVLDEILYNFQDNGTQYFKRFKIQNA